MSETWMFLVTGLLVGVLSGMLGIGGAVVLVPVLVLVFGFTQGRAQGTTIGALALPIGLFAAVQYHRSGLLDVRVAAVLAAGLALGSLGGATLVPYVPQVWLKRVFASVLVYVAAQMMFQDPKRKMSAALPGLIAVGVLWVVYGVKRAFGKKPPPPQLRPPPPDTEYFI